MSVNDPPVGVTATFEFEVGDADTALAMSSGDVPVLATPRVVALAERATVLAVDAHLPEGTTSVGTEVTLRHRRPSGLGATIEVSARLRESQGARLVFEVAAYEDGRLVAEGTVCRAIVDRAGFVANVDARS